MFGVVQCCVSVHKAVSMCVTMRVCDNMSTGSSVKIRCVNFFYNYMTFT